MTTLRRAATRLRTGSAIVARRRAHSAATWCRKSYRDDLTGWRAALGPILRAAILAGAAALVWLIVRARPWLMWILTAGWLIAAWRAGRTVPVEAAEEEPCQPPATTDPAAAEDAFRQLLRDAIGDRPGVHLVDVLTLLHRAGHFPAWEVADVRAACGRTGVPVRRSVKVAGRVAYGVHRDDLPTPSPAEPADRAA